MATVLLIEDNSTNLQLMAYLLRSFGHEVLEATDGGTGVALARKMPDLILCDIQMPGMDGFEVARILKGDAALARLPLVAVTALAMVGDEERIRSSGFDGYLSKPIEPQGFLAALAPFLRKNCGNT
jgi:two-component system cell cycle response regulator